MKEIAWLDTQLHSSHFRPFDRCDNTHFGKFTTTALMTSLVP